MTQRNLLGLRASNYCVFNVNINIFSWDAFSIKVFQMDSPVTDVVVFVFGIINILASVVVIYVLRKYLEKRFKTS
jgi:hypothetical protein